MSTKQARDIDGTFSKYKQVYCNSCDVLVINNHICHEHGCPEAFKDEKRECMECGTVFSPINASQQFCSTFCFMIYNNLPYHDEECVT